MHIIYYHRAPPPPPPPQLRGIAGVTFSPANPSYNALVICNHGPPHPRGIAGTLTFPFSSPAITPTLRGQSAGKTTAVFPRSLLCFHCTAFFAYITQIPGISPALRGQCKSKNTAHFHGYPPPFPGGWGAVVTND